MNDLYSPNRSIHISNLEKALAEARDELKKANLEEQTLTQCVKDWNKSYAASETSRKELMEALKQTVELLTTEQNGSAKEFNKLLSVIDAACKALAAAEALKGEQ